MKREQFEQFGKELGLTDKQINGAFKRMVKNKPRALRWLDRSFLSEDMKTSYKEVLEAKFKQLGLLEQNKRHYNTA